LLRADFVILVAVFLLLCFSLCALYSTSPMHFKRQAVFALAGLVLLLVISLINYRVLKNHSFLLYGLMLLLLIAVLIFGHQIRGASSWFNLGQFGFQPVELAKIVMIIILAKYFAKRSRQMHRWRHILVSGIYSALPIVLILLQPDLGSVIVLIVVWLGMSLMAGIRYRQLALILLICILVSSVAWFLLLKDYQKNRLLVFLNPELDPLGQGYNMIQSIIAVGSGGIFGKGLGYGSQSQLNFLPEQHTDFIFASIAEELGLFGIFILIILFGLLFFRCFKIIFKASDNFGRLLAVGIIIYLFVHIAINVGMNIGLMPITGIPLPFVSYGGSNLLISLIAIGLLQSVKINAML